MECEGSISPFSFDGLLPGNVVTCLCPIDPGNGILRICLDSVWVMRIMVLVVFGEIGFIVNMN